MSAWFLKQDFFQLYAFLLSFAHNFGLGFGLVFLSYLVYSELFSPPLFKLSDPVSVYLLRLFYFEVW